MNTIPIQNISKGKFGLLVTTVIAAGTLLGVANSSSKKQQIPQANNVSSYYKIPQMSLWNEKNVVGDTVVFNSCANQLYGSSGAEDTFVRTTKPNNGYWLTVEDIIEESKVNDSELSKKDIDLITSLYKKADKSIEKENGILNQEELKVLITNLEKSKLSKRNPAVYEKLHSFLQSKVNLSSTNYSVANNLSIASKDLKNSELIEKAIADLTQDSVYDIANCYYKMNKKGDFFSGIVTFGVYYNPDSASANNVIDKVMEGYEGLLKYAKTHNINTKDIEATVKKYKKLHRYNEMAAEIDNLFRRIQVTQDTTSDTPLNNRRLTLHKPNGQIDTTFAQGDVEDCWLLAAIIASLNDSGAANKINDMVTVYGSSDIDSIKVDLGNGSYTFDYDELISANEFSSGDLDPRALEIAVNKKMQENFSSVTSSISDLSNGFKQLYGEQNLDTKKYTVDKNYINEYRKSGGMSVVGSRSNAKQFSLLDENDKEVPAINKHAYAVVGADDKFLYVVNPWNSSQKLKCPIGNVDKIFNDAVIVNLKEPV